MEKHKYAEETKPGVREILDRLLHRSPHDLFPRSFASDERRVNAGRSLLGKNELFKALAEFREAQRINPENAGAWFGESLLLYVNLAILPLHPRFRVAEFQDERGAFSPVRVLTRAVESCERAAHLDEKNVDLWLFKGLVLNSLAEHVKIARGIGSPSLNVTIKPADAPLHPVNNAEEPSAHYRRALEAFTEATLIDGTHPSHGWALLWRSRLLFITGDMEEGARICAHAGKHLHSQIDPRDEQKNAELRAPAEVYSRILCDLSNALVDELNSRPTDIERYQMESDVLNASINQVAERDARLSGDEPYRHRIAGIRGAMSVAVKHFTIECEGSAILGPAYHKFISHGLP